MYYWLGISLGFVGSLHCLLMCGPVQAWLLGTKSGPKKFTIYHLGRIATYSLFGLLFGWIGISTELIFSQEVLLIILLIVALLVLFSRVKVGFVTQMAIKLHASFQKRWDKNTRLPEALKLYILGLINALLPCGLVYSALVLATAIASPLQSMLFMALFGLGTAPALLFIHFAGKKVLLKSKFANNILLPALNLLVIGALLYRGMQSQGTQEMILKAASDFARMCGF